MGQLVRMQTFPTAEYRDVPGANIGYPLHHGLA